jgi:hypothetical protein
MGNCCVNTNKIKNSDKIVYSDNEELSKDQIIKMRKTLTISPVKINTN